MSYTLKGSGSFDSAHFLKGHNGKCANLHGHRWTVEYEVQSEELIQSGSSSGMVIDFTDIKKAIKDMMSFYDHALLIEEVPIDGDHISSEALFIASCQGMGFRIIAFPFRTTAENLSKHFYKAIQTYFDLNGENWGFELKSVTVYETPNNSAKYEED